MKTTLMGRFYHKGPDLTPLSEAIDFAYRKDEKPDLTHAGSMRELDPKLADKIRPDIEAAIFNFKNRMKSVVVRPSRTVFHHEIVEN